MSLRPAFSFGVGSVSLRPDFSFGVGSVDNQKDFSLRGNLVPKSLTYKVVTTVRGFLPF